VEDERGDDDDGQLLADHQRGAHHLRKGLRRDASGLEERTAQYSHGRTSAFSTSSSRKYSSV